MAYILSSLLLVVLLIVFKVYKTKTASKQKLQHESERRTESVPTARPENKYHAIKVAPCDNSCNAASWISENILS